MADEETARNALEWFEGFCEKATRLEEENERLLVLHNASRADVVRLETELTTERKSIREAVEHALKELGAVLHDEHLTDETLREHSENLLPKLFDYLVRVDNAAILRRHASPAEERAVSDPCGICGNNKALAEIGKEFGFRPDVMARKIREQRRALEEIRDKAGELLGEQST